MPALSHDMLIKTLRRYDSSELDVSRLEKALTVKGLLDTDGELHIHGIVLGRVNAGRLVLGADGYVEGDIVAKDVHVEGRLVGRIFALNVTLDSSADIKGRIFHNTITVAKGARIEGPMPWRPPSYFKKLEHLPEVRS